MKQLTIFLLMVFGVALAGMAGAAKLYKWVDKDGNVSYHDQPPMDDAKYKVEEKNLRIGTAVSDNPAMKEAADKNPVVLYVAPKCASCDAARSYLNSRKIPFKEVNVEGNRDVQQQLIAKSGGLAVPTISVGEKVMRGYLESLVEGELNAAGYPKAEAEPAAAAAEAESPKP